MIGEAYFQTRAQLGTALFSLHTLAGECHAPAHTLEALQQLELGLREPFCFIVLGGVKSGKSSLFNALFGRDLFAMDGIDTSHEIQVVRFGEHERDVPVDEAVVERFRAATFLRDFHLVEAPDASRTERVRHLLEAEFIPRADLILFVLSATEPWAADAWAGLRQFDRRQLHRMIVIIQQADLRTPAETAAILRHVEKTLVERLGEVRPVFAVSARNALDGRSEHLDLSGTGFHRLEAYIDDQIVGGSERREKLAHVARTAQSILREIDRDAGEASASAEREGQRLNQLSRALADRREESFRQIAGFLWTLAQACEAAQRQAEKELVATLTTLGMCAIMIRSRPHWPFEFQRGIEQQLREITARQMNSSREILNTELRADWQDLGEGLDRHLEPAARALVSVPDFQELPTFEHPRPAEESSPFLSSAIAATGARLRVPAGVMLILAGLAVYGAIADPVWKEAATVGAALGGVACIAGALILRNSVIVRFRSHLIACRERSINAIEDRLRQAVDEYFHQLDGSLAPLLQRCVARRRVYDPIAARVRQLDEAFARCAGRGGLEGDFPGEIHKLRAAP